MPYVTKEQIARAREMDLLTYLRRYEPEELVHFSGDTYTTRTHDSLKISNGKWCWWSRGIGGRSALDYLIQVRGLTLPEAVVALTGTGFATDFSSAFIQVHEAEKEASRPFQLPKRHADNRRVFAYLSARGIAPEIINHCIKHGLLYEEAGRHNCVFVGYKAGQPCYGALRGTFPHNTFMGEVPGSDKRFSFSFPKVCGDRDTLCVFECAIDALSYLTLIRDKGLDWRKANCLSLGGIYHPKENGQMRFPLALEQYLKDNPHIRRIVLCLDNDEVGRVASAAIRKRLEPAFYTVMDRPPSCGKDYNELLQKRRGLLNIAKDEGREMR